MNTTKEHKERLGTGLRWADIGATDPAVKRQQQAALCKKIEREWREAQEYWKAYRARELPGATFVASA